MLFALRGLGSINRAQLGSINRALPFFFTQHCTIRVKDYRLRLRGRIVPLNMRRRRNGKDFMENLKP